MAIYTEAQRQELFGNIRAGCSPQIAEYFFKNYDAQQHGNPAGVFRLLEEADNVVFRLEILISDAARHLRTNSP